MTSSRLPHGGGGKTRRAPSLRKDARARYLAAAAAAGLDASAFADASADKSAETPLTAHARALYEGSVTPVREIARLAGVSERTLYKYVQKGGWRRRHACPAREVSANASRAAMPGPGF